MSDFFSQFEVSPEEVAKAQVTGDTNINVTDELPDVPAENTEAVEDAPIDLSRVGEDHIFTYLSGKAGREIKKWEDLLSEKEIVKEVPASYASEEVGNIDKYIKETGRSVEDYFKLQKDWSKVPDDAVVEEYLRTENPEYTDEEIKELADLDFGEVPINEEEMDEKEISSIRKENRRKELAKKAYVSRARKFFEESKSKYQQPVERRETALKEGAETWRNSMKEAIDRMGVIEIGDFKYELNGRDKYSNLYDLQKMMDSFKEDGVMNYGKLARTLIVGLEAEHILGEHKNFVESNTREAVMSEYSNKDGVLQRTLRGEDTDREELIKQGIKTLKEI